MPTSPARRAAAEDAIRSWAFSGAMRDLVALFGGEMPDCTGDIAAAIDDLEDFADFCWNFRRGAPRAVLHLLKHRAGAEVRAALPTFALDGRWQHAGEHDILRTFFASSTLADELLATNERLGSRVAAYPSPAGADEYRERWEAIDLPFDAEVATAVRRLSVDLDIVEPLAAEPPYDHVVVLGGGGRSPILRAEYAAEVTTDVRIDGVPIWLLGSPRPLDEAHERSMVADYAPDAADEFDLMTRAAMSRFDAVQTGEESVCGCTDLTVDCPEWRQHHGPAPTDMSAAFQHRRRRTLRRATGGAPLHVLSASTSRPPDRPNTSDTYEMFAELAALAEGSRVLIVTTQVFVPFQRFDAIRMLTLPFGVDVDVIGYGFDRRDRPDTPEFELQEILSGIRSARRLVAALT